MHQMLGVVPMATRRESRENVVERVELACVVESNHIASISYRHVKWHVNKELRRSPETSPRKRKHNRISKREYKYMNDDITKW